MADLLSYLSDLIDSNVDCLLPSEEQYALEASPLRTVEQLRQRDRKLIRDQFVNPLLWSRLAEAFRQLHTSLKEVIDGPTWAEVEEELNGIPQNLSQICQQSLAGQRPSDEVLSLQALLGLSNRTMQVFYSYGEWLLAEKFSIASVNHFALLCSLNGKVASYWVGLARAVEAQGDFQTAVYLLEAAISLNASNPATYMHLCQCYLELKEIEKAEFALEQLLLAADADVWLRVVKILRFAIDNHRREAT